VFIAYKYELFLPFSVFKKHNKKALERTEEERPGVTGRCTTSGTT